MTFYLPFLALLCVPVLIVLPALRNRIQITRENHVGQNAAVASMRMKEFSDMADEVRKAAEVEIKSTLLEDTRHQESRSAHLHPAPRQAVWILLFLPLFSIPVYMHIGNSQLILNPASPVQPDSSRESRDVTSLIAELENRLQQQPDNIRGWQLAAQTYMTVGSYDSAVQAYKVLNTLDPGVPDHLAGWADATIMAAGNVYTESAEGLVMRALAVDPTHQQALWLSALGASSVGNFELATRQLKSLRDQVQDEPETLQLLQELIARNQESMEKEASTVQRSQPSGKTITVQVSATPQLVEGLPSSTTVYIIARVADGPPAPLAVSRHRLEELPLTFALSRKHAMTAELNIEKFDAIEILARISLSGKPQAISGDIQSKPVTVFGTPTAPVDIEINSVVP